ncbi:MAG: hypothetical protein ACE15C_14480 [Phycisphaerae bacterium]
MAAGDRVYVARYAKHPTDEIPGITHFKIPGGTTAVKDQGAAGSTGRADSLLTDRDVFVELYGNQFAPLVALIGASKANCVLGYKGAAGANEKFTVKNVYFFQSLAAIEIPEKDSGGKLAAFGVRGIALWDLTDTFATMIVPSTDT